ncbi:MAG: sugar phosphate nucleotidyltransferase [Desulfobulbales bacterium]|nr:sugar phosphate nucleotidyltransferase [Desulfobulbales bacterium]
MKAMILAAGLGTRLRPYSLFRPKPLFPVLGRPLVFHLLDQLRRSGFRQFVVNANYLSVQFVKVLGGERNVDLQIEEDIIGTGGGLRMARPVFRGAPFLAVNGDILHSLDLAAIYRRHLASGAPVSLVVHDCPRFNNLRISADGRVTALRVGSGDPAPDDEGRLLAFTGIQVIDPEVLGDIPPAGFFDIIDLYIRLAAAGTAINAIEVSGHFWTDIGTAGDYLALHGRLLTAPALAGKIGLDYAVRRPVHCPGDVVLGREVRFRDWAFVGAGARIGDNARLIRSVVWDGALVPEGAVVEDEIVVG